MLIPPRTVSILWKGKIYRPNILEVPDDLARALGYKKDVPDQEPIAIPRSLNLINNASNAEDIEPIPGIGSVRAKTILERRPDQGYKDFRALMKANEDMSGLDWSIVEAF